MRTSVHSRPHKVIRGSMVDYLAKSLSEHSGTTFTVLREKLTFYSVGFQDTTVTRYRLRAERHGISHIFGGSRGFTNNEMKYYLASLCDLVSMGFLPLKGED